ncbi:uncharacterized protein LOC136065219 [Quercus suber]|uniref:Uncharacterized protein n=1 Tax=Quercus suber TaxID=58331 RepID=A0AAW0IV11_QUESU|nr:hypothetical protein CFP56_33841 [Quercus suber]
MKSVNPLSSKKNTREDELARLRSTGSQHETIRSKLKNMGPICKSRKESAAAFLQSSIEEEIDLDMQFGEEKCSDDSTYTWLSSDCTTPSSFFEEYRLSSLFNPSSDEFLGSRLSLLANLVNELTPFNESARKPKEEASSALENIIPDAEKTFQNNLNEVNVVTGLLSSTASDANANESTVRHSENAVCQSCENSKSCDNPSSPFGTKPDSSSQILDLEKTSYSVSLMNLDGEDSNLISDNNLELDYFLSGFPSPSFKNSWCSEVPSSSSSVSSFTDLGYQKSAYSTSSEHVSEATSEDFNADEPLFWPYKCKFDWSSGESWKWFCPSPRKDILTPSNSVIYSVSLMNLDGEDSNLISDNNLELDYFLSGFPSPSFKNSWCSEVPPSSSSVSSFTDLGYQKSAYSTSSDHVSEATSEDFNADEPLFWPYKCKFDWSSGESWKWFCPSPRKDILTPSNSVIVKFPRKKVAPKEGCRKRLVFSSGSIPSRSMELKQEENNKDVHRINTVPSRLSKSTKRSAKIVPLEMKDDIIEPKDRKLPVQKFVGEDNNFSKEVFASKDKLSMGKEDFALDEELPIETLLGLDEFDGHEGIDSGFDGDVFSLDELLR